MHSYEVGKPYQPGCTRWPETAQYNYRSGGHELVLFLKSPTAKEFNAIKTGKAEFALLVHQSAIFLCHRFGGGDWSDSPYSYWLVSEEERTPPIESERPERRALLDITLVDADTGLIKVLRAVTLSPEFTEALHAAINDQVHAGAVEGEPDKSIADAYAVYPTTDSMVRAAKVRCEGGD